MKTTNRWMLSAVAACLSMPSVALSTNNNHNSSSAERSDEGGEQDASYRSSGQPKGSRDPDNKRRRDSLEEVIVTAQRRAEDIKDVPISITAMSGEQLQSSHILNTLDLSFAVPGLAVAETSPGRQIIAIRGIGSERGTSSLTGVYLDETPVTGAQDGYQQSYIDVRTVDLKRVEVLKGPQGTLFGEGSVGGTVRWITNDPDLQGFGGELTTSVYSTDDGGGSQAVTAIGNLPILDNVLGLRVAGTYENTAGWIDQPSISRVNINDGELYNVRVKGLWEPTPEMKIRAMAVVHRNNGGASSIVNQSPYDRGIFLQAYDRAAPTSFSDDYNIYNITINYRFGFAELLSSTSLIENSSSASFTQLTGDAPIPEFEQLFTDYSQEGKIKSQELRLTSSGDAPLAWTIGALYKDVELEAYYPSGVGYSILYGAVRGVAPLEPNSGKSESFAEYADLSYAITSRLKLGGGLRYFSDRRESFNPTRIDETLLKNDFDALTFRAYASFRIGEATNAYFTVGDGARSGGMNSQTFIDAGGSSKFDPEYVLSYELGIKTVLLDRRVSLDAALFFSKYDDMQENSLVPTDSGILAYTSNDQAAELWGAEWDLTWMAADNLTLGFSGDFIHSEITERANASPFDVGDPLNFVPKYRLIVNADYRFHWGREVPGFVRADFSRQGESQHTLRRLEPIISAPYSIAPEVNFLSLNLGAEYRGWDFSLFGRNLTDERGIIRAGTSGLTSQARPRTVGMTVGRRF